MGLCLSCLHFQVSFSLHNLTTLLEFFHDISHICECKFQIEKKKNDYMQILEHTSYSEVKIEHELERQKKKKKKN